MSQFFIHRPIFAIVISLLISIAGIISIKGLPISQYPDIAAPKIMIWATYPGASAKTVEEAVTVIIEREMNGVPNLMFMEATSSSGESLIYLTFKQGTDSEMATVEVQNRLKLVEPVLPESVRENGVYVERTSSSFLCIVALMSTDARHSDVDLGEIAATNVLPVLRRVDGVGRANLYGSEKAMRVWVDPEKLTSAKLTAIDLISAIDAHSAKLTPGSLGGGAVPDYAPINASITPEDYLNTPEEFRQLPLRTDNDGASLKLGDVSRIELASKSYDYLSRLNGHQAVGIAVMLTDGANALQTARGVRAAMESAAEFLPPGVEWDVPYDTSTFVSVAIGKVVTTLVEAVGLVFLVMFLFMQNIRATLIPTVVVPVAMMGAFAAMYVFGFSINLLTMFGLVLAIGILVDDAIVVVENVERLMVTEGLAPREAAVKAMKQISGAIIGVTLVLTSVFIPMAFFSGAAGNIYRQFALALSVSIGFSAFLALSLTPALCATFLKPISSDHQQKTGFFGWFNRSFNRGSRRYAYVVKRMLGRPRRWLAVFLAVTVLAVFLVFRLPTAFLPSEDQGSMLVIMLLPTGSTQAETLAKIKEVEEYVMKEEPTKFTYFVQGYSSYGGGTHTAMSFIDLKDLKDRPGRSVDRVAADVNEKFAGNGNAMIQAFNLPPIPELSSTNGFDLRLQDRGGLGHKAFSEARTELLTKTYKEPSLMYALFAGQSDAPQMKMRLDRHKALSMGVTVEDINATLSVLLGSSQVADFVLDGQVRKVVVQAEGSKRIEPDDVGRLHVRNGAGKMVPLSSFLELEWTFGPPQYNRYNGFPSFTINGEAAPGFSSGRAMETMERLAREMPRGLGFEWSGQSYEEILSGNQTAALYTLSVLIIFLVLAALYESWSIPLAVLLVVPLGIVGAALATNFRGLYNDIYFKVGLITIIGLSAKNAILIIEVARELWRQEGKSLRMAVIEAARLRLRPIIMTSLAFGFGVLPLAFSSGAGSGAQVAVGNAVLGGIITATVLAIFLVPLFFQVVVGFTLRAGSWRKKGFGGEKSVSSSAEFGLKNR